MRFSIDTRHPIAVDSPDHLKPLGTKYDNTVNFWFNDNLMEMFEYKPSVLDFGCAGGGMVHSLIKDGCVAVGIEGSDYSLKRKRAEWAVIPDNLFTCDIGYPFRLSNGSGLPYQFDVITMWEFVEHLPPDRIDAMITNARIHLKNGGYVFGSTNDIRSGGGHHQTLKPMSWWYEQFAKQGFERAPEIEHHFNMQNAWVRVHKSNFALRLEK